MFPTFRLAMSWIHTWVGLVTGYVLMVVFFFGTLAVFDHEIDRWAVPDSRYVSAGMPSWSETLGPAFARVEPTPEAKAKLKPGAKLSITFAQAHRGTRRPTVDLYTDLMAEYPDGTKEPVEGKDVTIDPRTGAPVSVDQRFPIGTWFFYPMHLHVHLNEVLGGIGYWIVGAAAMGMLIALVSGVVIHRKLFAELFTFRPWKNRTRSTLDLHDVTGVLGTPFHFIFALTGLIVFGEIYLPLETLAKPLHTAHAAKEERPFKRERAGQEAPLASVDAMMQEAARSWGGGSLNEVGILFVRNPGDANASVSVYRIPPNDRATLLREGFHFSATTGALLGPEKPPSTAVAVVDFLKALHLQPFDQWLLHSLYFGGGLIGCVCLATGMILFVRKRRQKHPQGARWADAFAIATVTGIVVATLALFVANRLLPTPKAQMAVYWIVWLLSLLHGLWRRTRAWLEQCWAAALLALLAVLLNAVTTGDHLLRTLFVHPYRPVAGVDLMLVVVAVIMIAIALRLRREPRDA